MPHYHTTNTYHIAGNFAVLNRDPKLKAVVPYIMANEQHTTSLALRVKMTVGSTS